MPSFHVAMKGSSQAEHDKSLEFYRRTILWYIARLHGSGLRAYIMYQLELFVQEMSCSKNPVGTLGKGWTEHCLYCYNSGPSNIAIKSPKPISAAGARRPKRKESVFTSYLELWSQREITLTPVMTPPCLYSSLSIIFSVSRDLQGIIYSFLLLRIAYGYLLVLNTL